MKFLKLTVRNTAKHGCINIPTFRFFCGIHIPRNIQIVIIGTDEVTADDPGKLLHRAACRYNIYDTLDVAGTQDIIFPNLGKSFGSIHNQHIRIFPLLLQNHDNGWNACTKENICRKTDDCINVIQLDQVFSDCPLLTTPEQNTVRQNDGHNSIRFQMEQIMKQKRIVRFPFRCNAKPRVPGIGFFISGIPCLRIWRIGNHSIYI